MKKFLVSLFPLLAATLLALPGLAGVQNGDMLIPFAGKTTAGKNVNLQQVIGRKPVLLFFWATW
jgi:hypothetical protein